MVDSAKKAEQTAGQNGCATRGEGHRAVDVLDNRDAIALQLGEVGLEAGRLLRCHRCCGGEMCARNCGRATLQVAERAAQAPRCRHPRHPAGLCGRPVMVVARPTHRECRWHSGRTLTQAYSRMVAPVARDRLPGHVASAVPHSLVPAALRAARLPPSGRGTPASRTSPPEAALAQPGYSYEEKSEQLYLK